MGYGIDNKKYIVIYNYENWDNTKKLFEDIFSIPFKSKAYQKLSLGNIEIYLIPDNYFKVEKNCEAELGNINISLEEVFLLNLEYISLDNSYSFLKIFQSDIQLYLDKNEDNDFEKEILKLTKKPPIEEFSVVNNTQQVNHNIDEIDISQKLHIIITGEFSKGKTKLINQLIKLFSVFNIELPEDLAETTSSICKLHFSKNSNKPYFKTISGDFIEIFDFNKKNNLINEIIEIVLPLKKEKSLDFIDELVFVDTPGLNGNSSKISYSKVLPYIEEIIFKSYIYISFKQLKTTDFDCFKKINLEKVLDSPLIFDLLINLDNRNPHVKQDSSLDLDTKRNIEKFKKTIKENSKLFTIENDPTIIDFNKILESNEEKEKIISFIKRIFLKTLVINEFELLNRKFILKKEALKNKKTKMKNLLEWDLAQKELISNNLELISDELGKFFTRVLNKEIKPKYESNIISNLLDQNDISFIIDVLVKSSKDFFKNNEKNNILLSENYFLADFLNKEVFSLAINNLFKDETYSKYLDFLKKFKKTIKDLLIKNMLTEKEELKDIIKILEVK